VAAGSTAAARGTAHPGTGDFTPAFVRERELARSGA